MKIKEEIGNVLGNISNNFMADPFYCFIQKILPHAVYHLRWIYNLFVMVA